MTLEELMAAYPTPWQISGVGYVADANGRFVTGIVGDIVVEAVNCVSELTAERDELKAKVEELERERDSYSDSLSKHVDRMSKFCSDLASKWDTHHAEIESLRDQRRFEAACAFGASHYGRGMFSAEPSAIAAFAVKYADALLAELAKPKDAAKEGTT